MTDPVVTTAPNTAAAASAQAQTVTLTAIAGTAAFRVANLNINDSGISITLSIGMVNADGVFNELAQQYGNLSPVEAAEVLAALPTTVAKGETAVAVFAQLQDIVLTKLRTLGRIKI